MIEMCTQEDWEKVRLPSCVGQHNPSEHHSKHGAMPFHTTQYAVLTLHYAAQKHEHGCTAVNCASSSCSTIRQGIIRSCKT